MTRCFEALLAYGISGSGKTTQLAELMRWCREKISPDCVGRLISTEGWAPIQREVDAGIIEPYYVRSAKYPFQEIERLSMGWWPDANGKLIPPEQQDMSKVAVVCFDSMTDISDWIMNKGLDEEADGAILGINEKDGTPKWVLTRRFSSEGPGVIFKQGDKDDETVFAMPSRATYGATHRFISKIIANSKGIQVPYVYWTAREDRGKDERKNAVYGPEVSGEALTGSIPAWFDRTVRMSLVSQQSKEPRRIMYLSNHFIGNDPIPYLANVRAHYKHPIPNVLVDKDFSLYKLLQLLEETK